MAKFKLLDDIYMCETNNRPCRIYLPAIWVAEKQVYWVAYITGEVEITLVDRDDLQPLKHGNILFSEATNED